MCGHCGCHATDVSGEIHDHRLIQLEQDILAENNQLAQHNRAYFTAHGITALNLISSPGSGKTTLLETTLAALAPELNIAVIEGDQQTDIDAQRIAKTGVPVLQINTGKSCHLDAHQISHAVRSLAVQDNSLLFIENVGNLVCPALFDLGETDKIVMIATPEGEDKPLKYPEIFHRATVMVINKIDLLPYVNFSVEHCIRYARQINPAIQVLQLSATTGAGLDEWLNWLRGATLNAEHR